MVISVWFKGVAQHHDFKAIPNWLRYGIIARMWMYIYFWPFWCMWGCFSVKMWRKNVSLFLIQCLIHFNCKSILILNNHLTWKPFSGSMVEHQSLQCLIAEVDAYSDCWFELVTAVKHLTCSNFFFLCASQWVKVIVYSIVFGQNLPPPPLFFLFLSLTSWYNLENSFNVFYTFVLLLDILAFLVLNTGGTRMLPL